MKPQWKSMSWGLMATLGVALPGMLGGVTRAEAQTRKTPRTRSAVRARAPLPRLTIRSMTNDLAELDPQAVKLNLNRYRVVQVSELMEAPQIGRLVELTDDNSTARRNQNLMTNVLRQSQRLSSGQTVVGADRRRRQLFVVDNRAISPTHGIR